MARRLLKTIARVSQPQKVALGGSLASAARLKFNMKHQKETNWCWAAVSSSVSTYFGSASKWTQCRIADVAWKRTDSCGTGSSGPCNHPWLLDKALGIVNCFDRMSGRHEAFGTVKSEIAAKWPLAVRVGWAFGGGHFLAIYGWQVASDGTEYYDVEDPIYRKQTIERSKLETAYQHTGHWTHSYFVKWPAAKSRSSGGATAKVASVEFTEAIGA
jgi:hypothetical protein